jgi:NADH-quinone oxidoreductase subunit E
VSGESSADAVDIGLVDRIVERRGPRGTLISILADVQQELSYLPRAALQRVARLLEIPLSQVFSVSTFYKAFSLAPRGKHSIKVCLGTACHVKGAGLILERLKRDLGVEEGGTTADGQYTLETVRCVGCCSIAPVVTVDESAHGRLKQEQLPSIIRTNRARAKKGGS